MRIDGLPESISETWETTEQVCVDFFASKLDLLAVKIERAHRTGVSTNGKPRTIVVKLLSFKDRESILNRAKDRKISGVFINQEFSSRVSKIRKELRPHLQKLRSEGVSAYISYDRICVKRNQHDANAGSPLRAGQSGHGGSSGRGRGRGIRGTGSRGGRGGTWSGGRGSTNGNLASNREGSVTNGPQSASEERTNACVGSPTYAEIVSQSYLRSSTSSPPEKSIATTLGPAGTAADDPEHPESLTIEANSDSDVTLVKSVDVEMTHPKIL